MGGMFTVIKIREGLARNDYTDPGWYKHPQGTVAHEWTGGAIATDRAPSVETAAPRPAGEQGMYRVRKPSGHSSH